MPTGFAILAALFIGVPLWYYEQTARPAGFEATGVNVLLSLILFIAITYGLGWLTGYAFKRIRHG